jgi:hypothetical protein
MKKCNSHLESVEIGYSDIFLEYSIYMTTQAKSMCLEYSDIYLEYVNPFPLPGICLEYAYIFFQSRFKFMSGKFQVYITVTHCGKFLPSQLVICLEYTWSIPLLANQPPEAMRLGCRCCHSARILGVKGV